MSKSCPPGGPDAEPAPAPTRAGQARRRAGWRYTARRWIVVVALLAVTVHGSPVAAGSSPGQLGDSAGAPADAAPAPADQTATLITGDRVTLLSGGVAIRPGPGRSDMVFEQYRQNGRHVVIPADAVDLVNRGRLDRRLFDVTTLLEAGYGDAQRADLPLIVAREPGVHIAAGVTGAQVTREMPEIGVAAVRAAKRDAGRFWNAVRGTTTLASGVDTIWLDGQRTVALDQSVPQVGAPAAWQAGYTGAGVTVAVLDTGIDATHPDFAERIDEARNFTEAPNTDDNVGHGTHVASILAGTGAASDGQYRGVAPDARLLVGKVCPSLSCPESAILAGMAWAAEQGATVVNLSLGGPDTPDVDPLEHAVNRLTAQTGTLFVVSAGNSGTSEPVSSPASADAALAVGSVDRQDFLAETSSRGPRVGDAAVKPDMTAPGVGIVAARAAGGFIGEPVDASYTRVSGTSMAAPHVAGAAALLAQQHPDWTAAQLKAALMGSARPNPAHTAFEQGAGRLDVARAIEHAVVASPPSISLGRQPFPHDDDEPVTRVVSYHNLGDAPVSLDLSLDVTGPDGLPAPAGMFTVQPGSVVVPPGGEAEATVTADTWVASPLGHFTGALLATAGDLTVRTALGIDKEPERYDLTLVHLDRTGAPTERYTTNVLGVDTPSSATPFDPDGTTTLRLPPGRCHVYSVIRTPVGEELLVAALAQPLVELTEDVTIELDARTAQPMRVRVPDDSARSAVAVIQYQRRAPNGRTLDAIVASPRLDNLYTAALGPAVPAAEVMAGLHSQWGEPTPDGTFMDSPYVYNLAWFQRGSFWSGFDRRVLRRDLAVVPAEYRSPLPDRIGLRFAGATAPEGSPTAGFLFPFHLPFQRTEYYLADDARWLAEFQTVHPQTGNLETVHSAPFTTYQRGRQHPASGHHLEQWNRAVFGPAFPQAESATQWVYRHGGDLPTVAGADLDQGTDAIAVSVPLYNDFSDDHSGFSREDSGRTALYRNGELIGETGISGLGEFPVPDADSAYRLEVEGVRPSFADRSTSVSATWTFRSAHDPDALPAVLPLMAIRFSPTLDEHNSARAGRAFTLPVAIQRQTRAPVASTESLSLEVSYDEGTTWRPVPVTGSGDQWQARLHHPDDATSVSLRAAAADSAGNSVQQTIIRAYGLVD